MGRTTGSKTTDTRERLLDAAERLYAEHGVDAVSRADINREARVGNRSAVNYHFGGKQDLLLAILERHETGLQEERQRLLEELAADGPLRAHQVARALAQPLGAKLRDPDGGHAYLLIAAQLVGHPDLSRYEQDLATVRAADDLVAGHFEAALTNAGDEVFMGRAILVTGLLYHSMADYVRLRRSAHSKVPIPKPDAFVEELIEGLSALISAPLPVGQK